MADMNNNIPPEVAKLIPGTIGSVGALLWIKGSWPRKIALVVLGSAASFYGAPRITEMFGLGEGLSGFLVGLFGMSVVDSIFRFWQDHDIGGTINEVVRARLGLPPRPTVEPPKEK